jgi:hypothetical protein
VRLSGQLAIGFLIANYCTRWRCNFKRDGGQQDFFENLRASLFNDDLSNEPNFGRSHLAGQYGTFKHIKILQLRLKTLCHILNETHLTLSPAAGGPIGHTLI